MRIVNAMMRAMFDNEVEVNILLYFIALVLELAIRTNVIMHMKRAGNHKSPFIEYVPYIPVWIRDVIMQQPFFILKCESTACIFGRSFETITHL